jgi:flagellar FliL protein
MAVEAEALTMAGAGAPAEEGKKSKKKLMMIVLALVVAAAGAKFFVLKPSASEAKPEKEPVVEGEVLDVGVLVVNLNDSSYGYARVGLAVVTAEGSDAEHLTSRLALLKDAAISEISHYKGSELASPKGQNKLRDQLTEQAHEIYHDGEVIRVVLTELVIQ